MSSGYACKRKCTRSISYSSCDDEDVLAVGEGEVAGALVPRVVLLTVSLAASHVHMELLLQRVLNQRLEVARCPRRWVQLKGSEHFLKYPSSTRRRLGNEATYK